MKVCTSPVDLVVLISLSYQHLRSVIVLRSSIILPPALGTLRCYAPLDLVLCTESQRFFTLIGHNIGVNFWLYDRDVRS